jgi:hypothetical protein
VRSSVVNQAQRRHQTGFGQDADGSFFFCPDFWWGAQ